MVAPTLQVNGPSIQELSGFVSSIVKLPGVKPVHAPDTGAVNTFWATVVTDLFAWPVSVNVNGPTPPTVCFSTSSEPTLGLFLNVQSTLPPVGGIVIVAFLAPRSIAALPHTIESSDQPFGSAVSVMTY